MWVGVDLGVRDGDLPVRKNVSGQTPVSARTGIRWSFSIRVLGLDFDYVGVYEAALKFGLWSSLDVAYGSPIYVE